MTRHPALQLALFLLLAWSLLSLILRLAGSGLFLLLLLLAAAAGAVLWMLRHRRPQLAKAYQWPVAKQFIDLVCRLAKMQPPVDAQSRREDNAGEFMLREPADFPRAAQRLQAVLRGHDEQIERLLDHLRASIILRASSVAPTACPLGVFLFAGPSGVGKRRLAVKLARMLYRKAGVIELNLSGYADDASAMASLFGSESKSGRLIEAVKHNPYHAIVMENIEAAPPRLQQTFASLFANGALTDPATSSVVDFRHCMFFLLTTTGADLMEQACERAATRRDRNQQCRQILAENSTLDPTLLTHVGETFVFRPLRPLQRAEAVLLVMQRECRKYNIALDFVDPQLLAEEVKASGGPEGFALTPARVAQLLREPLVRSAKTKQPRLSLRPNEITLIRQPEAVGS